MPHLQKMLRTVFLRFYFAPLRLLQSRQSIWQFSATVRPPSRHGVMWSASISSNSKCRPQMGQKPLPHYEHGSVAMHTHACEYFNWQATYCPSDAIPEIYPHYAGQKPLGDETTHSPASQPILSAASFHPRTPSRFESRPNARMTLLVEEASKLTATVRMLFFSTASHQSSPFISVCFFPSIIS